MPVEYSILSKLPIAVESCPSCGANPFDPFMRGMVQRSPCSPIWRRRRPYCALICDSCREVVGYEGIGGEVELLKKYR